jgi:hypothetical protein
MSDSGVFGAIGAVLGYIGGDAATKLTIERLLWPQRSYSNFTVKSVPLHALLMPMGGPLHTVCLEVLDIIFDHGIFKGGRLGHMLGTSFYPSLDWTYTMWDASGQEIKTKEVANALWVRALSRIPIPTKLLDSKQSSTGSLEEGPSTDEKVASTEKDSVRVRSMFSVSRLTFAKATDADKESGLPFVSEEIKTPTLRTFVGIFTAETTGILVAVGFLALRKELWAIWWLVPLFLRLLSALSALDREGVKIEDNLGHSLYDFEIHCPNSSGHFMLFTGPPSVVRQFFVHYGHPMRNRFREMVQLVIIVLFGAIFPFGLFCSVIWMPLTMQYTWLCYQMYVVLTMLVTRYFYSVNGTSTEAGIAEQLSRHLSVENRNDAEEEAAILFGQKRNASTTIKASLLVTYHDHYKDGEKHLNTLLHRQVRGNVEVTTL